MKKLFVILLALLVTDEDFVLGAKLLRSVTSGGTNEGDPAPGRSPGPPSNILPYHSNNEQLSSNAITSLKMQTCDIDGGVDYTDEFFNINVTINHELFDTKLLVPGIEYQVAIRRNEAVGAEFLIMSRSQDGSPRGLFHRLENSNLDIMWCAPNIVKGRFVESASLISLNWTLHSNVEVNKLNVTFTLKYKKVGASNYYEQNLLMPISQECQLWLLPEERLITSRDFPTSNCQIWFPGHSTGHGLVVELNRLNIPCTKGNLSFSGLTVSQHQHVRSHRQVHLCGKLEELPETDRHIYFPSSYTSPYLRVHGNPVFSLFYHLVDYCYNITFVSRNGSFELKPTGELQCTFKINLPYGNRVALMLLIGDGTWSGKTETDMTAIKGVTRKCDGLHVQLVDGDGTWAHCSKQGDADRRIEIVSRENKIALKVTVRGIGKGATLGMRMKYRAEPMQEIVGLCGFGWIAVRQFCVSVVEGTKLPWAQAEMECTRRGGHLASIRNEHAQHLIDNLLINSPGYKDRNAYWIGASDKTHEGDFHWSDGLPFSYTNWFPGWSQHGDYNRQPNDDGLSEQDCVEVRRIYALPSSSASLASSFMWNDRLCSTPNYFLCERLQNDEPLEDVWSPECNRSVVLSRQQPRAAVSSPGFPRQYPDYTNCETTIVAPPGYRLILDFEELVLENEPSCSYDYLEIIELSSNITNQTESRRLCGDWSSKLKLLRHVSGGSRLKLRFSSDYSHHFGGFKARVSMESALQCSDDRLQIFNNSCYLFVSYPEVMWTTAQQICKGIKAQLASVISPEEERFITTNIRKMSEYRTSGRYWLGGWSDHNGKYSWIDGNNMSYLGWLPGQAPEDDNGSTLCLGIQWTTSPTPMLPSGLYWKAQKCNNVGGYVCKRPTLISGHGVNFNKTVNGTEGKVVTPNYPGNYYNNLDFTVRVVGPDRSRIVIQFDKFDIESQIECLYDYIEMRTIGKNGRQYRDTVKWCGTHEKDIHHFNFVSESNEAQIRFHSDYSITGAGFLLRWHSVDTSGCPMRTLTATEGVLMSPNYPNFLLAKIDCTFTIIAPPGRRVWLDFEDIDIGSSAYTFDDEEARLDLKLGESSPLFRPFQTYDLITEGSFVSNTEQLKIRLKTLSKPNGRGFRAIYKTVNLVQDEKVINLTNNTNGILLHLNYPANIPQNVDFLQHFIAPFGYTISVELFHVKFSESPCGNEGTIEIYDNYSDMNGTSWHLCYDMEKEEDMIIPRAPIAITSFLNTLHLRQKHGHLGIPLNGTLKVNEDKKFMNKILKHRTDTVESCQPNPCLHEGKCVHNGSQKLCQCLKHYTGIFCALTQCDLEPCVFGTCELTRTSFKCHCKNGYMGPTCEQRRRPCESNPCDGRGACQEKGDGFFCQCHAWWEGTRCERRMMHIPYKPLSERMLREPFWLGLMTVSVVMGVIGLFWCAKRHFPEKIEKLLAEEEDRNRGGVSSLRSASVREQLAASGAAAVTVTPSPGPGAPRSLFGRLGIRKPSILSLTSPHASGYSPATARTFSLDDLLKPPPRRTPSPKKKRNNSTPTKKNAAEKKQILQQLVAPNTKQSSGKVSLGELMQMSERKLKDSKQGIPTEGNDGTVKETKFSGDNVPSAQLTLTDPKLEKKVTFARLLSKVSAEMSSGSEMELGIMQANRLSCAFARPSSTPPSPGANARSPNSTSSNQGSDSLTSSDLAIPSALSSSISDLATGRRKLTGGRQKPSSADSILAMFRNFSSSSAGANLSPSFKISPSTTPTASTPQDDVCGDDESSTSSSLYTPISMSGGTPESPVFHRSGLPGQNTIEVSVLDSLSAHKSSSSGSNFLHPPTILLEIPSTISKCLSPIREMPTPLPTPLPSPAVTPLMRRSAASSSIEDAELSDDRISIEIPNISTGYSDEDDPHPPQDIIIDPQAEDGLILEDAASMQSETSSRYKMKNRPPPLGQALNIPMISITGLCSPTKSPPPPLIIPTLTIETPSPTHRRHPALLLPGSPPPRPGLETFQFPSSKQGRKMFKDFDKPTSLDLPGAPPMITITCNMSEAESDAESISPNKNTGHLGGTSGGMSYLSPFSMVTRGDHTASESNLSSSGYSSMASPGPSRCGSSNPLCPSEMEDPGPPGPGSHQGRRPPSLLKSSLNSGDGEKSKLQHEQRGRSDSETLSDDILMESNDEGIGTDHLDEKIEDGELKSAKELEVFMCDTKPEILIVPTLDKMDLLLPPVMKTLQLPSIVVNSDSNLFDKMLSPVSSRSESPLSDRTSGVHRFSSQFYGRHKDILPFTDSDGLYDFPSSDKVNISSIQTHKKTGRKRDKKLIRQTKTPSPTKSQHPNCYHLELPYKVSSPRKPSPKRRSRTQQPVTSSSSSDSITSSRDMKSSSSPSPDTIRWATTLEWPDTKGHRSPEASGEETGDEASSVMLPKMEPELQKQKKISKLRAISHQIRFLRRLELSLKRRDRAVSPSESLDSGDGEDSPRATSPLLQVKGPREIKKSQSIGKIQSAAGLIGTRNRRGKLSRSDYHVPEEGNSWRRVTITGNGHSD